MNSKKKLNRNLSVTLDDNNLFLKSYRGSSKIVNLLLNREFAGCPGDPEKIARAAELYLASLQDEEASQKAGEVREKEHTERVDNRRPRQSHPGNKVYFAGTSEIQQNKHQAQADDADMEGWHEK